MAVRPLVPFLPSLCSLVLTSLSNRRWMFLIEACFTLLVGIASFWMM